jgi:hypothetical protein
MRRLKITLATFILILTVLMPVSCQNTGVRTSQRHSGIDSLLSPYVNDYIRLSNGLIKPEDVQNIPINFENLKGGAVGICYTFVTGKKEVVIDPDYFEDAPEIKKRQLINHELSHCVCGREHDSVDGNYEDFNKEFRFFDVSGKGYFDDMCPKSIMNPQMLTEICLNKRWGYYTKEMFDRCSK